MKKKGEVLIKIFKVLLQFFCNLKDLILCGAVMGLFIEAGVILFLISFGHELELLTVVVTYLFATLIGIAIALEVTSSHD